ncbi:STE12 interacting protein [Colletotrichum tofieldiae]|nr:STE12 interacting protein [Colletotrichum tofieldiae]
MSPTYTMSAHLCKSIYASWRETRRSPSDLPSPGPFPEKRSMDSDRSDTTVPMTRSSSSSSWRSGPK